MLCNLTYDDLYRLTSASTTAASSTPYIRTYSYNGIGNITSTSHGGTYTYNDDGYNNPHAADSINSVDYTYDNNGNVTGIGSDEYEWDYRNRLNEALIAGATTTYGYDHNNLRVKKAIEGGDTTVYPNKYYNEKGATTTKHIFNDQGGMIATIEGDGTSTSTNYIHTDHLGGTNVVTSEDQSVVEVVDYFPYGDQRVKTGTFTEQRKHTGSEYDTNTDLTYREQRYYDQDIGKFMSQDPVSRGNPAQFLADPQQFNMYSYARNNPLILTDPDGRLVVMGSRPISGPVGAVGAHTFISVIPDNPDTIGSIDGIDTSRPFTLGGYTTGNGDLFKQGNESVDYAYAFGENRDGASFAIVSPPQGMTSEEFDRSVVGSYNGLPQDISNSYGFGGQRRLTGNPNSNNVTTSVLGGAGISQSQINAYQRQLYAGNFRATPGLGHSAFASTYAQSVASSLNTALNTLGGVLSQLSDTISSESSKEE